MKFKAIHIDDEKDSHISLKHLLTKHCPNVDLIASAISVDNGIQLIQQHKPHLVFLDVEMPGKNGFELFKDLDTIDFHTVMVTGYEDYAIDAIQYAALDYLLKPISGDKLKNAISKLNPTNQFEDPRLMHLAEMLQEDTTAINKLIISSSSGFKIIQTSDIEYIETESGNYCVFHLVNGQTEVVTKPLTHFQQLLPTDRFFRVNRSQMINLTHVTSYCHKGGKVKMSGNKEVAVTLRKRGDFNKVFLRK